MKKNFYQTTILLILIGTLFIGGRYLLSNRTPEQSSEETSQLPTLPGVLPKLTPVPTSTPILPPLQSTIPGDVYYFYGDWESAISSYQATMDNASSPDQISAALLGLGKVYFQKQDYQQALDYLRLLVSTYPDSVLIHKGFFTLAETFTLDRHLEAADAYNLYLTRRPGILDAFVQHRRGDALSSAEEPTQAIEAYQAAIAAGSGDSLFTLQLKIGQQYASLEDHATAIVIYKDVYIQTDNDYTKARSDYLLGLSYLELGQDDLAEAAFQDAVIQYPLSYDSYLALLELVNGGFEINDLDRGLVDYFAGQYSHSVEAFDRYLIEPDARDLGTALYYKGFALRAMGKHEEALGAWDALINQYPDHSYWDQAWEFKAYSLWFYMNRYNEASQVLLDFVSKSPYHPRAAEFLFDAARVEEMIGDLETAADLWKRVFNEYPTSSYANMSLFKSGISQVRLGAFSQALDSFSTYRDATQSFEELSQALFWIGKVYDMQGNSDVALAAWSEAASADPPETNLNSLGLLGDDPRIVRGTELWELGLYNEARTEFEELRNEVSFDPISSYRLANYYIDLGLYRPAINAARQVLNAAGMDDVATMNAPAYFNHIRFGTYYSDLVIPAGQEYGFHPLFLFSVIRQESLFEGFVRSTAGARGLMQIIPSTGAELEDQEDWPPDYSDVDLYRPQVSIKLGTAYLGFLRSYFDGDIYATLAAYNAGGGNTSIWLEEAQGDQDLFLEIIRFSETQLYLKNISEIFAIYRRLYTRTQ